ncbi:MAG: hemerythrin family protein [Pseudomonadota bacterium]
MTLITWRDEFKVGVPAVDYEHKEMIDLINQLYANLGEDADRDSVLDFLGEVFAKISAHFALEERIMRECDYDQLADHKADHERLLEEIRDIMDEVETAETKDYKAKLSRHLESWFTEHFKTRDARLHKKLGV